MTRPRRRAAGNDPVSLSDAIASVARDLGSAPAGDLDAVTAALWAALAPLAPDDVEVRSLRNGNLTIVAADGRVAADLRYRAESLAAALHDGPTTGLVHRIKVVVRRSR